ncbi:LysM domain-containing protein [Chryseobacterium sp.]|jgi:hypothetical protein|uniref:LysM domain-containing protein n=1 Tax=Chryseobacterium sp. TaxID=1871047 RepID=UPI00283DFF1A|nr:LysM domain-containing protein [Chryseobacterium sp.]MDR3025136.1 LysM domain-containing protein [Chryseobacterium sp.]
MSIYLRTHIVQRGETLEDIVSKYDIPDVEMLRYFHNQNSPKNSNHIGSVVFPGEEIFIPEKHDIEKIISKRIKIKNENKAIEAERLKNQVLIPYFLGFDAQYFVKIVHYFGNKQENKDSLGFNARIKYVGTTKDGFPIMQYQKGNYKINGEDPELKLYNLVIQSTDFIYPLEISLSTSACPHGIINLKEITARWKATKEKTNNKYTDAHSQEYVEQMNRVMDAGLQKYLMRDLFLQFFFAPYTEYSNGKSSSEHRFHNYRILYQNIMELENMQDKIIIKQAADCIDSRTPQQILDQWYPENDVKEENTLLLESSIWGEYQLDKQYKTVQSAKVHIKTLFYGKDERMEITIDRI